MEDSANKKNQNREDEVSALLKNYLKVHETFSITLITFCSATDVTINHQ
jgi:hypothetical protein